MISMEKIDKIARKNLCRNLAMAKTKRKRFIKRKSTHINKEIHVYKERFQNLNFDKLMRIPTK